MKKNPFLIRQERPVSAVPKKILFGLVCFLLLQVGYHSSFVHHAARASELPSPPASQFLSLFALSDTVVSSKLIMLWLQAFDNQPGLSIPFLQLDYDRVIQWLALIQRLDEKSAYPLLSASRLYSQVPDEAKTRKMLEFVQQEYLKSPDTRWRWMAHSVYVAKHKLEDMDLALKYARIIRKNTSDGVAPSWVRQMEIFILEDMNEIESAKVLIGGLLESGEITDENEYYFLTQRLREMEEKAETE